MRGMKSSSVAEEAVVVVVVEGEVRGWVGMRQVRGASLWM